jgi:hypothetical protein
MRSSTPWAEKRREQKQAMERIACIVGAYKIGALTYARAVAEIHEVIDSQQRIVRVGDTYTPEVQS